MTIKERRHTDCEILRNYFSKSVPVMQAVADEMEIDPLFVINLVSLTLFRDNHEEIEDRRIIKR